MKQGTLVTKITMFVLFAGVLCYLGTAVLRTLFDPYSVFVCYSYTTQDAAQADGWIVREERAVSGGGGTAELLVGEGERVSAGSAVAVLYASADALALGQEAARLERALEQLDYAIAGASAADSAGLDEQILSAAAALRANAAAGRWPELEEGAQTLKGLVLRRAYAYSTSDAAAIQAARAEKSARLHGLQTGGGGASVTVSASGLFSAVADGREAIFTPQALESITVSGLRALGAQPPAELPAGTVGKLITSSRWRFAALLPADAAARLRAERAVTVSFSGDFSRDVVMRVEHVSDSDEGLCAVVLSSSSYLSELTLLRAQTADVVFSRTAGIRIPKKALRVLEDGTTGVYAVVGSRAKWKPVAILTQGEDFYLVTAAEGAASSRTLRAGNEIVISAAALYDGKLVK